jgi:FAD/FMN-containing dehydrogenase
MKERLNRRALLARAGTTAAGIGIAASSGLISPSETRAFGEFAPHTKKEPEERMMATKPATTVGRFSAAELDSLAKELPGEVIRPGNSAYDQARHVWNAAVDRRPALIVRPKEAADVVAAVNAARDNLLPLAVRGGGHSPAGYGTVEGGLVIDFSSMKRIDIDADQRIATAMPGLTWGEFNAATNIHGLAAPGADVAKVGIAGTTLGGGMSWLMRKHGMTIDNLLSVDLVTADGRQITASDTEYPDLFWALRGGGGNFGVATRFRYRLNPAETVLGGAIVYPVSRQELRAFANTVTEARDELTTISFILRAPPLPFIPKEAHDTPVHLILPCYSGDLEAGEEALAPLRMLGGASPLADTTAPLPYPDLYKLTDTAAVSRAHSVRNAYLRELKDETIEIILDFVNRFTSPFGLVALRELGGAMARVPPGQTAFAHRDKAFYLAADNAWENDPEPERHIAWTEDFLKAVAPYTDGAYASYMEDEGAERIRSAYPPGTYEQLAELKWRYDPGNLFLLNPNIRPA